MTRGQEPPVGVRQGRRRGRILHRRRGRRFSRQGGEAGSGGDCPDTDVVGAAGREAGGSGVGGRRDTQMFRQVNATKIFRYNSMYKKRERVWMTGLRLIAHKSSILQALPLPCLL